MKRAIIAGAALAVIIGGTTAFVMSDSASQGPVESVQQPATPQGVASALKASNFLDCGPAALGGVTDSGTAYLNHKRIGINVFPGADIRDQWKATARNFGVVPTQEGPNWVVYIATNQSAKGCN